VTSQQCIIISHVTAVSWLELTVINQISRPRQLYQPQVQCLAQTTSSVTDVNVKQCQSKILAWLKQPKLLQRPRERSTEI